MRAGDGHGVGEVGASFGLVVDFPLHDVGSAGGAFFGFVFEEPYGDLLAYGYIDGPERFVVSLIVEGDGEGLEGSGDIGEGIGGAQGPARGVGDELFDAPRSEEGGARDECSECEFGCA